MAQRKKTGGRHSKLTPAIREKVVSAIRAGNYARVAAQYAGIGERTFYRWLQQGQAADSGPFRQFWQAVKDAESEAEVRAVALVQKHMADSWQASMTFLERKFPERWGRRDRLRIEKENPISALAGILGMTEEEVRDEIGELARRR